MSFICKTHKKEVQISTGIHDGLTYGHGELDNLGFWEIDCKEGEDHFADLTKEVDDMKRRERELLKAQDQQ